MKGFAGPALIVAGGVGGYWLGTIMNADGLGIVALILLIYLLAYALRV